MLPLRGKIINYHTSRCSEFPMGMGKPFTSTHQEDRQEGSTPSETDEPTDRRLRVCSDPFDVLALEHEFRQTAADDSS